MKLTIIIVGLILSGKLYCQNIFQRTDRVELGVFIHSIGVPFLGNDFFKLDHMPGFTIGATLPLKSNDRWQTDYRLRLSGYAIEGLHSGLHLDHQIIESFKATEWLKIDSYAGLGYLRTFEDAAIYIPNNGGYKQKRDNGNSQITISIGFGISFRLNKNSPYWLFADQQLLLQLPFASKSGVPFLMHNRTHLGLRREINLRFREQ